MTGHHHIIPPDEPTLSARDRGHRYHEGDIIVGDFDLGHGCTTRVVRYERHHGCGGYYGADGNPVDDRDMPLVRWRYATTEEIEQFEAYGMEES